MQQDIFVTHLFLFLTPLLWIQLYLTYDIAQRYFNLKDKKMNFGPSNLISPPLQLDVTSLAAIRKRLVIVGVALSIFFFIISYLPQMLHFELEAEMGNKLAVGAFGSWLILAIYDLLISRFQLSHVHDSKMMKGEIRFSPEYVKKLTQYKYFLRTIFSFVGLIFIHSPYMVGIFLVSLLLSIKMNFSPKPKK